MAATKKRLLIRWGIVAGLVALLVVLGHLGLGIPCPMHSLTGLYCPGCGSMRALVALTRLDFAAALRANVLVVLTLPLLAVLLVRDGMYALRGTRATTGKGALVPALSVAGAFMLYAILRNFPAFWFLAPN